MSSSEIASVIKSLPNYVMGTPVKLITCDAASSGLAKNLAPRIGADVLAAPGLVATAMGLPFPVYPAAAAWKTFSP